MRHAYLVHPANPLFCLCELPIAKAKKKKRKGKAIPVLDHEGP
jgi:hypothetical protein